MFMLDNDKVYLGKFGFLVLSLYFLDRDDKSYVIILKLWMDLNVISLNDRYF